MEALLAHWTKVYALATIGMGSVLLATLVLVILQLRSSGRTHQLQAYIQVRDWLQREETRRARRRIYELADTKYEDWSQEDRWEIEKACHNFNGAGNMVRKGLIGKELLDDWGWTMKRCWRVVKPMIEDYRVSRGFPALWKDFEWLAEEMAIDKKTAGIKR